jgi:hypothetical protein
MPFHLSELRVSCLVGQLAQSLGGNRSLTLFPLEYGQDSRVPRLQDSDWRSELDSDSDLNRSVLFPYLAFAGFPGDSQVDVGAFQDWQGPEHFDGEDRVGHEGA